MILYFSGTGNSAYIAKRVGKATGDEVVDLFEKIRNRDFSSIHTERPLVVVTPTYAWRLPRIVEDWMERTTFTGDRRVYFILTCGENIGNAGKYLEALCGKKGLKNCGCMGIVMPENYIALFATPSPEEAAGTIAQAEPAIQQVIRHIQSGTPFPRPKISVLDVLCSGPVNSLFYPLFVHAKKFRVTSACISCGRCASVCPLNNIHMENGRPVWKHNCTHCMACICRCPTGAIEYGKHSEGLPRYVCGKED